MNDMLNTMYDAPGIGLAAIQKQADLGGVQRDIETEGITADRLQFEQEREFPYKQVQYMQSLLQGLPIATQSYTYTQPTALETLRQDTGDVMALISSIFRLILSPYSKYLLNKAEYTRSPSDFIIDASTPSIEVPLINPNAVYILPILIFF